MGSDVPPVLIDLVLNGPEIAAIDRAFEAVFDDRVAAAHSTLTDEVLDVVPAARARWRLELRHLGVASYGVTADGLGLQIVSMPPAEVPVVITVLKSRLFDLSVLDDGEDDGILNREREMIVELIFRFEGRL